MRSRDSAPFLLAGRTIRTIVLFRQEGAGKQKTPAPFGSRGLKGPFGGVGFPFRATPLCHGHVEDLLTRTPPPWNRVSLLSLDPLLPGRIPHRRSPPRPVPWAAQAAWNRHVTPGRRRGP